MGSGLRTLVGGDEVSQAKDVGGASGAGEQAVVADAVEAVENEAQLYDVTSTYFEGQAERNLLAERGYSRD